MSIKTFLTLFLISGMPILMAAQKSKFALAIQTTTIETPPLFGDFAIYAHNRSAFGTHFHKDYSLEIIGKVYLKEHIALRLRAGVTQYDFDQKATNQNLFDHTQLTGKLEKYAVGIETNHFFGKSLAFRLGGDLQLGFFKDMTNLTESNNFMSRTTFATNSVLSLNPFLGGDWWIGRSFALSAEFRMPFERVRYQEKGIRVFNNNGVGGQSEVDFEEIGYVGFGTPISSIQLSYRF